MEAKILHYKNKLSPQTANTSPESQALRSPLILRMPRAEDGPLVTALIEACAPLDRNSAYCNLLQCSHFAGTCVIAESDGELAGWLSGYKLPDAPDKIFVWQVGVHPSARGQGLGLLMLDALMARPASRTVDRLLTTITQDNTASWNMFASFARRRGAEIGKSIHFEQALHFAGTHASEYMVSIGPLTQKNS